MGRWGKEKSSSGMKPLYSQRPTSKRKARKAGKAGEGVEAAGWEKKMGQQ